MTKKNETSMLFSLVAVGLLLIGGEPSYAMPPASPEVEMLAQQLEAVCHKKITIDTSTLENAGGNQDTELRLTLHEISQIATSPESHNAFCDKVQSVQVTQNPARPKLDPASGTLTISRMKRKFQHRTQGGLLRALGVSTHSATRMNGERKKREKSH